MDHSWTEKFKKSKSKSFPISQLGHSPWRGGRRRSRSHGSCASSRCTPPATWRKARHHYHRHHRLPAAPSRLHLAIRNRTIEAYKALVGARFSHFPLIAALARPPRLAPMVLDPFSATTETMISSERARNRSPAPPWPSREEEKEEMGLLFGGSLGFSSRAFASSFLDYDYHRWAHRPLLMKLIPFSGLDPFLLCLKELDPIRCQVYKNIFVLL